MKAGKSKVNAGQLQPHELLQNIDAVSEEQWKVLVTKTKEMGRFARSLVISDLSGSMDSDHAIWVSKAMGLLISECCEGVFHNQLITFSSSPTFHNIKGTTLAERLASLNSSDQGLNTNLRKTFEIILNHCKKYQVSLEHLPERIFIISDMQFDSISESSYSYPSYSDLSYNATTYQSIKKMYQDSGYQVPKIIFWNVRGNFDTFPVSRDDIGVCAISGFSPAVLKPILEGDIPSPLAIMKRALDAERYSCLEL